MATRHRSFATKTAQELKKVDPLTFDLGDETFHCRPTLPGAVVLDFVAVADEGSGKAAGRILGFFDYALIAEDKERWDALLMDPDRAIEMETITDIVSWLIEEYTSRPTAESK